MDQSSSSSSAQCVAAVTWVQAGRRLVIGVSIRREMECKSGQSGLRVRAVCLSERVFARGAIEEIQTTAADNVGFLTL